MYIYGFIYVILTAVSMVLIHDAGNILSPALNLFLGALIAIIFFHALNLKHLRNMYVAAMAEKWLWFKVMVVIAITWISTIYGPVYVSPNIFILNYFSCLCILGIIATLKKNPDVYLFLSGAGVMICAVILTYMFLHQVSFNLKIGLGIFLGLLGGASSFMYSLYSHAFAKNTHFTVTQILAIRFWLVEFVCLPLITFSSLHSLNMHTGMLIIIIAFVSLILPVYFYMKSIFTLGPEKNAIICGLIPVVTYLTQSIVGWQMELKMLVFNLLTGFFIGLPYIIKLLKKHF